MSRARTSDVGTALRAGAGQAGQSIRAAGARLARSRFGRAARSGAVNADMAFRAARSFASSRTGRTIGNATTVAAGLAAGPIGLGIASTAVGLNIARQHRRHVAERRQFIQSHMQRAEAAPTPAAKPTRPAIHRPSVQSQIRRGQAARAGTTRATRAIAGRRRMPPHRR